MFAQEGEAREQYMNDTTKNHLIPRPGKPEEVAPAAMFLLENQFVTGTIVDVDGGAILA
jgi:NAD(P)-dependent dehydrogenase (short-subunit alcohol dehydrogenase family)